jgi:hypothetical protein
MGFLREKQAYAATDLLIWSVVAAVAVVLLCSAVPRVTVGPVTDPKLRAQLQAVNNSRQIQMAIAGKVSGGWPGELKAGGAIRNLPDFIELMVRNGVFNASDLKIFAGPGFKPYKGSLNASGHLDPPFTDENCAYKIYRVRDSDPGDTVFLRSKPDGKRGVVVMRKGGDCSTYKNFDHAGVVLPGGGTVETPENCLNP